MRLAVDVGGTFTDVVLEAGTATGSGAGSAAARVPGLGLTSTKVLTTPSAPEVGVLAGVEAVLAQAGAAAAELAAVVHGTTLATNALIERRGARCAFVTTAGFRDVVETRTESRFDQYDLNLVLPRPLVERRHRYVLRERISARGEVLVPFDDPGARRLAETLARQGYESVAVGFLHSYRNPDHEHRFRDVLRTVMPEAAVSISSEVSPQMRELERFNTVCANAYVQPAIARYLHRLRHGLRGLGAGCGVYMIHSGGGLMSLESAAELPVRLVESGPAGGAIFAADIAARHGLDRVLSYDMGGTTAKICLIEDSTPRTAKTFEVARTTRFAKGSGMSISIPVIEMIEIGAGGGSIAAVDMLEQIRVGPRSAGAHPGPACYGRGGDEPTVTDADLVLGRLSAETFGAPEIDLDPAAARRSLVAAVGERLGLDAGSAAVGVSEVVDENMANAARVHAVESGKVLDGFTMIAFGGAAPAHAARLASKLGIGDLLVPPGAGVGSAIGFLRAPFAYEAVRSHYARLDDFDPVEVREMLSELTAEAVSFVREAVAASGADTGDGSAPEPTIERWAHMRYAGQGWEIPVELPAGPSSGSISGGIDGHSSGPPAGEIDGHRGQSSGLSVDGIDGHRGHSSGLSVDGIDGHSGEQLVVEFTKAYEQFFGRAIEGLAIEAVGWSVRASVPQPRGPEVERAEAVADAEPGGTRQLMDTAVMSGTEAAVVPRAALSVGMRVPGPAVIVEPQTTTVVPSTHEAVAQPDGCLLVRSLPSTSRPSR